jgi:hypothetical protein
MSRRQFGAIQKLPSGRWRGPDYHEGTWFNAPKTCTTKPDASDWLATVQTDQLRGAWRWRPQPCHEAGHLLRPGLVHRTATSARNSNHNLKLKTWARTIVGDRSRA